MNGLNPLKIKQLLNRSLTRLDQPTLARLRDSRAQALACYERRTAPTYAWAGNTFWTGKTLADTFSGPQKTNLWAAALLLVIVAFSTAIYWQQTADHDTTDVDIAILTDELPIHIYLD